MNRLTEALRSARIDEGFSLVEVVVAMIVLALLATGISAGTGIVIHMTAENRSRQVAVNLAEQQLDTDRGILDPFNIHCLGTPGCVSPVKQQVVSGRTYSLTQATSLVSDNGSDISCGSAKSIYYRRISVAVTWTGMLPTSPPVTSDTILAPNGRINDSSTGSIAIMVTGATGGGESGVAVTVTPVSGTSTALQEQPAVTDVDGCSYALGVYPGTYKVAISRFGSVDTTQNPAPFNSNVVVMPGATSPVTFSYDDAATYPLTYATGTPVLPSTMPVTLLTSNGSPFVTPSSSAAPSSLALYPYGTGYTAIAGAEADANGNTRCAAQDPAAWPAGLYNGKTVKAGSRGNTASAAPGGAANPGLTVPMGTFTVSSASAVYLTAVAQSVTVAGQPPCATPQTFTFSTFSTTSTVTLALPFGTYKLYSAASPGLLTNLIGSSLAVTPVTDGVNGVLSSFNAASGVLTLDPRATP